MPTEKAEVEDGDGWAAKCEELGSTKSCCGGQWMPSLLGKTKSCWLRRAAGYEVVGRNGGWLRRAAEVCCGWRRCSCGVGWYVVDVVDVVVVAVEVDVVGWESS